LKFAALNMPPADMFWGNRWATLDDPFGHHWSVATHVRDVSPEEIQQAMPKCERLSCKPVSADLLGSFFSVRIK
jgi:hypothetical protein